MTPIDEKYHKELQWLRQNKGATKDDVRHIYESWAPEYDKIMLHTISFTNWRHIARAFDVAALKAFPAKRKDEIKIIDVAAGTGLAGVELSKLGYTNIDALDMSQEMLNQARKKNVYQRLVCSYLSDQKTSEIETGQYDALTCVNAIGNKYIIQNAMTELCRIVSKGGLLCFDIFDEDMVEWQQKLLQMVNSGILECVTKEKVPLYNFEGRQTETNAFVFKVLKN